MDSILGDAMTPEEKNRIIAEKVMGWYIDYTSYRSIQYGIVKQAVYFDTDGPKQLIDEYDPYHHIEQAMEAIQRLKEDGYGFGLYSNKHDSDYLVQLFPSKSHVMYEATADTPSAAIVDAIVEVVGRRE